MPNTRSTSRFLMLVTFLAFVSIGFPDAVLGVAWPQMRLSFDRALSDVGFILFSSGAGYFLSGIFAGRAIETLGVGKLLAASTSMVAIGLFGYAAMPSLWPLLAFAVIIGLGSGAIDTGLNFFAAEHFSVTVMNWLHAFFGIGAMLGPFIVVTVFAAGGTWRIGYVVVASIIAAMAVVFILTMSHWGNGAHRDEANPPEKVPVRAVLRSSAAWLQILMFHVMAGIEAAAGLWTATLMIERFGAGKSEAGIWAGLFWGAMAVGRLVLAPLSGDLDPRRLVQLGTLGVLGGALLMIPDQKLVFQAGVLVFGLAMAPLFPTLMSLTPRRLGSGMALHAIGFQVSAATLGIVTIPTVAGIIAERTEFVAIPIAMAVGAAIVVALETRLRATADRPAGRVPEQHPQGA
jgi:fucose permease